ncbi:hypothetical protein A0H81_03137 [Grifola frondosa]|uniref:Uncharacterized protein n=1 Tax=Grifola frondosa TaxID=5627 RepID=A0A1C7MJG8_GRIFR|nr:hypothetical protein A0H81_03137 [Grifola frondosa]
MLRYLLSSTGMTQQQQSFPSSRIASRGKHIVAINFVRFETTTIHTFQKIMTPSHAHRPSMSHNIKLTNYNLAMLLQLLINTCEPVLCLHGVSTQKDGAELVGHCQDIRIIHVIVSRTLQNSRSSSESERMLQYFLIKEPAQKHSLVRERNIFE